jgi:hypothetical protein
VEDEVEDEGSSGWGGGRSNPVLSGRAQGLRSALGDRWPWAAARRAAEAVEGRRVGPNNQAAQ